MWRATTGGHPSGGGLVSAFFLVLPGRRGVARRARPARRSRDGVAMGPAVRARNGTPFALQTQTEQRQLASGRNLHPGQGQVGLFIGCWGATEQKTGLSKFQATSSRTSAGFLNGRNSPRVTASGTEKA